MYIRAYGRYPAPVIIHIVKCYPCHIVPIRKSAQHNFPPFFTQATRIAVSCNVTERDIMYVRAMGRNHNKFTVTATPRPPSSRPFLYVIR